jgi:DNA helicase II / ATP-dependent DNA helicase PcrA
MAHETMAFDTSALPTWLEELNDAQRAAVSHGDGPLLLIAGAGTGKTKTLAARVAWLIGQGVAPSQILLLTFTRRAAEQMLSRAARYIGQAQSSQVWGGTFHAVASRLLREFGPLIGLDAGFNVIDQEDSADLMEIVRADLGLNSTTRRFPRKSTLAAVYSRMVNSRTKLTDVMTTHFPWCMDDIDGIRQIFDAFTRRKREQAVLDYDDLLLYWHAMLNVPAIGFEIASRFAHVLVDEYQDTNPIQADILRSLRKTNTNCMVVGDDAQSIYSFRSATIENMLQFPTQFPGTQVMRLEQNYRSVQPILDASNRVMSYAEHQFAKNLFSSRASRQLPRLITVQDEQAQSVEVCKRILERVETGIELKRQAVLFRTGHHSDALEVELAKRKIPFIKYGGLKFVETAHVKDMLALLKIVHNPSDEMSWHRVLTLLDGVGSGHARKILGTLLGGDVVGKLRDAVDVPAAAAEQFDSLRRAILHCIDRRPTCAEVVEQVRLFYQPIFEKNYDNPTLRIRDIEQLEQIATAYTSLRQFVTDLSLDPPTAAQDHAGAPLLDDDYLILSTIHSAKGCEWDIVHVLHVADGNIPADMSCGSDAEIAEERRLFYVAMTRAKDELNLYFPLRYYFKKNGRSDRHSYAQVTRFIPPQDMRFYERVGAGEPRTAIDVPVKQSLAADVDALLGDLWK